MSKKDLLSKIEATENLADIDAYTMDELLEVLELRPEVVVTRFASIIERNVLRSHNLSTMTLRILFTIMVLDETSQSEILKYVNTSAPNLSQRIKWLEKEGLIKISRPTTDRRIKKIKLTTKGTYKTRSAMKDVSEFKSEWAKRFDREEMIQVMRVYMKVSEELDRLEAEEDK